MMMPTMATADATPSARDAEQLWALAQLLVNEKQVKQAIVCLELCRSSPGDDQIALQANILLADCCLAMCQTEPKEHNRELWWKRYKTAERCIHSTTKAVDGGGQGPAFSLPRAWGARLFKCKFLLAKLSKSELAIKNRHMLQNLCDGIRWCFNEPSDSDTRGGEVDTFRTYFVSELRGALVKMYTESMLAQPQRQQYPRTALADFEDNLKLVRSSIPSRVDASFQLWLIEISCHVLVVSPRFGSVNEATNALAFADRWISGQQGISSRLKMYHLIIKGWLLHRSGEIKKLGALVDELKRLRDEASEGSVEAIEPFLGSVIDSLDLEVMCRYDPCQAVIFSMKAIHQVQANIQVYAARPEVHLLLLGLLFDMLFIHCDLHRQQARYYEMGVSIAQLLKLFGVYRHHLETSTMLSYYVAQIHIFIAKYAYAVGRPREGDTHVHMVLQQYLLATRPDENAYPLYNIRLWTNILDATTYCSGVADPAFVPTTKNPSTGAVTMIKQICPTLAQLNMAARVLTTENLRATVHNSGSVELRARYELSLCKWLWATHEICSGDRLLLRGLLRPDLLERVRPEMLRMLHESLELVSTHVNCTEATSEIMALYGSQLIQSSRFDNGEETLKSAIRLGLHSKNILLQSRLLVDVFVLYRHRQLVQAQATTAEKYEKKISQLQRRVLQAQTEEATNTAIFTWSLQNN